MTAAKHYTLADPAREDLIEMVRFSEAEFGERQTMKYLKAIHEGTECIGKSQRMFQSHSEFSAESGLSVYSIEIHYMICLPIADNHILVLGYLGQEQDISNIIRQNAPEIDREISKFMGKLERGEVTLPRRASRAAHRKPDRNAR